MRRFNPEKELYKIQHGNKNKIIAFVFLLLVIIGVSSSYALYQVRYSKRIIYTKVAPFNTRDVILSVKVEGESTPRKTFPNQDEGFRFSWLECDEENTTTGSWNFDTWSLILDTKGPNRCTVFFNKAKLFNEVIKVDNVNIFDDDPGKNLRYAGADPNNYIWFNCDNYDGLTQSTAAQKCEKWRIIGLMKNITKSDGKQENLVKIIRAEGVVGTAWDSAGTNNWVNSSAQKSLVEYYNGTALYNAKGITKSTRDMIEQVKWNIGGHNTHHSTPTQCYTNERGTTTYQNSRPSTWNGYIGLMYVSDHLYATTGSDSGIDRATCLTAEIASYGTNGCSEKDWFLDNGRAQWTLTPDSGRYNYVFHINGIGGVNMNGLVTDPWWIRPTIYLKSNVKIVSGDGDQNGEGPYIIVPQ